MPAISACFCWASLLAGARGAWDALERVRWSAAGLRRARLGIPVRLFRRLQRRRRHSADGAAVCCALHLWRRAMAGHRAVLGFARRHLNRRQCRAPLSDHRDFPRVYSASDRHRRRGAHAQTLAFVSAGRRTAARAGHRRHLLPGIRAIRRVRPLQPLFGLEGGARAPQIKAARFPSRRGCSSSSVCRKTSMFRMTSTRHGSDYPRKPAAGSRRQLGAVRHPGRTVRPVRGHQLRSSVCAEKHRRLEAPGLGAQQRRRHLRDDPFDRALRAALSIG